MCDTGALVAGGGKQVQAARLMGAAQVLFLAEGRFEQHRRRMVSSCVRYALSMDDLPPQFFIKRTSSPLLTSAPDLIASFAAPRSPSLQAWTSLLCAFVILAPAPRPKK